MRRMKMLEDPTKALKTMLLITLGMWQLPYLSVTPHNILLEQQLSSKIEATTLQHGMPSVGSFVA